MLFNNAAVGTVVGAEEHGAHVGCLWRLAELAREGHVRAVAADAAHGVDAQAGVAAAVVGLALVHVDSAKIACKSSTITVTLN